MTITATQLENRSKGLGGSDAPTILGVNPFKTAYDLYLELTGKVNPPDLSDNPRIKIGNAIEGCIADLTSDRLKTKLVRPTATFVAKNGFMRANVDFMLEKAQKGAKILEAKSTGLSDNWGEDGSEDMPDSVRIQLHHQFICAESDYGYAGAIFGSWGLGFGLYLCPRSAQLCEIIEQAEDVFWHKHVLADIPPEESLPSIDLIKKINIVTGKTVTIDLGIVNAFDAARAELKAATERKEEAEKILRASLGDAEVATAGDWLITNKIQNRDAELEPRKAYSFNRLDVKKPKAVKPAKKGSAA